MVVLVAALGSVLAPGVARADTGGYPDATMPCEWFPQARSGPARTQWCKNYDWGTAPATVLAGQENVDPPTTISPRGFGYRNCTDFVAFKLGFDSTVVHGNAAQWKDQMDPADVTRFATVGAVAWWGTILEGFGHVAVVLSLKSDGSVVVGEYNYFQDGTYDTRTISQRAPDAFLHIKDEAVPGGRPFVRGSGPPPLPAPPLPAPPPAAAPPAAAPPPPSPALAAAAPAAPPATPQSKPAPAGPDVRMVAASALTDLAPRLASFRPPKVMRPRSTQLVEVLLWNSNDLAVAVNQKVTASAAAAGTAPPPAVQGANLITAILKSPEFHIVATTPDKQPLGTNPAVWQWTVTPLRRGRDVLTLCLSVDVSTADGVKPSSSTCMQRMVSVTTVPTAWPWLLVVPLLAGLGVAAAARARQGNRARKAALR